MELLLKDGRKTRIVSAEQCKAYFQPTERTTEEIREPTKNPGPEKLTTNRPQSTMLQPQQEHKSDLLMPDILHRRFPEEQPSRTVDVPDNYSTKANASSQGSNSTSSLPSVPSSPFLPPFSPNPDQPIFENLPGPSSARGRRVSESSQTSGSTMTAHYDADYPEEFSMAIKEIQAEEREGWSFVTRRLKQRARINLIKWSKSQLKKLISAHPNLDWNVAA